MRGEKGIAEEKREREGGGGKRDTKGSPNRTGRSKQIFTISN